MKKCSNCNIFFNDDEIEVPFCPECKSFLSPATEQEYLESQASDNEELSIIERIWNGHNEEYWQKGLDHYWNLIKFENAELEKELNSISETVKKYDDIDDWYSFLLNKYFPWKYTAANRLATTTRHFINRYEEHPKILEDTIKRLFQTVESNPNDIRTSLSIVQSINGLGTAGASGLIAILFPEHFGTVDQFVVYSLRAISSFSERPRIMMMNPEGLKVEDGVALIEIMRKKAKKLNTEFDSEFWTPRKVDMVLWACREWSAPLTIDNG